MAFSDITIEGFDEAASGPSGDRALVRLVLRLSASAPPDWARYFNQAWAQHIYMLKRRAQVAGNRLEIIAMPEELEREHLPELKKVIAETNAAYAPVAARREKEAELAAAEAKRQKDELRSLKDNLKF
jgi:hypothetical protein